MYMYINMYIHMITYVINSHFGGGNTNDHPLDLDNTWMFFRPTSFRTS